MKNLKNKKIATLVLILVSAFAISLITTPQASAHSPPWTIISHAYLSVAPNPVGVGQTVSIVMWIDAPLPGATVENDVRRHDYTLTITKPDGNVETKHWDVVSDTTSLQFYQYTPTQTGNYTLAFNYPQQTYTWSGAYQNDIITAANTSATFTVQEELIPAPIDSYPLPTEYWTRPIEGQNTYWFSIASNWLGNPYIVGANAPVGLPGAFQPYGSAPNSAHVMWTKPIQYGGVVGGNSTANLGEMYYQGGSYNVRFTNPLIMQGTLFYQEPYGNGGSGGYYLAVDLRTGQELWRVNTTATGTNLVPSFGYIYSYESPNQHGALPNGALVASTNMAGLGTVWRAYDPRNGVLTTMNITNVPSGISIGGPKGEYLTYILVNLGTTTNPKYNLMQWNSSKVFGGGSGLSPVNWYSGTANASLPTAFDWNVSLSLPSGIWSLGTGGMRNAMPLVSLKNNILLLVQGGFGQHPGDLMGVLSTDPGNITAISLSQQTRGQVLWTQSYPQAPGNNTRMICGWDSDNGIFVFEDEQSMLHSGYSLTNGNLVWGPVGLPKDTTTVWNYLSLCNDAFAYGNFYYTGYSGILYCFDVKSGNLEWTYGNGGEGNSTLSGLTTPYGRYPTFVSTIADGKVYLNTDEHSPDSPLYKGAVTRCINATDGTEIWTLMSYGNNMYGGVDPVADGYLSLLNTYDCQIYTIGKGPSAMTVDAPTTAVPLGSSVVLRGTVTDISAGTKQAEQAARFPYGVPAVSDESQSQWMEYVYMQKPRPMDTTGVQVTLSVVDANGNYREIGTVKTNDGFFTLNWKPDIEGQYTVYASFVGSESYWPSHALTSFAVDPAAPTPPPTQPSQPSMADTYLLPGMAAIIVVLVIIGAMIMLMLRKRP